MSAGWRFAIAYNAGLQAATAALAAAGIELRGTTITIVLSNRWSSLQLRIEGHRHFDASQERNISSYDLAGSVSDKKRRDAQHSLSALRGTWKDGSEQLVRNWLKPAI